MRRKAQGGRRRKTMVGCERAGGWAREVRRSETCEQESKGACGCLPISPQRERERERKKERRRYGRTAHQHTSCAAHRKNGRTEHCEPIQRPRTLPRPHRIHTYSRFCPTHRPWTRCRWHRRLHQEGAVCAADGAQPLLCAASYRLPLRLRGLPCQDLRPFLERMQGSVRGPVSRPDSIIIYRVLQLNRF